MFKKMILRVLLVLVACWSQSNWAASTEMGSDPRAPGSTVCADWSKKYNNPSMVHRLDQDIARNDSRTDNPLLFQIGPLYVLATKHTVPISVFSPPVLTFLDSIKKCTHLVEHDSSDASDLKQYLQSIGGIADTIGGSVCPHAEEIRAKLKESQKRFFDRVVRRCELDSILLKPWAAFFLSFLVYQDSYRGMDDSLKTIFSTTCPLAAHKEAVMHLFTSELSVAECIGKFNSIDCNPEMPKEWRSYLEGDLYYLGAEMNLSDRQHNEHDMLSQDIRKNRNIVFAKSTMDYLSKVAPGETFFVSMGNYHLLGEYGYLNLMSALLGKPLLRFDDRTGEFVARESYLDLFVLRRPALLEELRAQGIVPVS